MNPATDTNALVDLRGYHLPDPVSWWPPAPGWWVVAIVALAAMLGVGWILRRRWQRRAGLRAALLELDNLGTQLSEIESGEFARRLSRLLRRYALSRYPRSEIAGLAGEDWIAFLDRHGGSNAFSTGVGKVLLDAPYRPHAELPRQDLLELVRKWIRHNAEAQA